MLERMSTLNDENEILEYVSTAVSSASVPTTRRCFLFCGCDIDSLCCVYLVDYTLMVIAVFLSELYCVVIIVSQRLIY